MVARALLCVLLCGARSSAATLTLQHNQNFGSGLLLTCLDGVFPVTGGVTYQRNGVDVDIETNSDGTLSYPLTQDGEGHFTCAHDGQTSQVITLAGINVIIIIIVLLDHDSLIHYVPVYNDTA